MEGKALGKGLSALIPEKNLSALDAPNPTTYLETRLIRNNSLQPRLDYPEAAMQELMRSIKEKGILQPILVRRMGDSYEVVAGERRLRAARALNLEKVPVIVKDLTNREALVIALIENIQRKDLNPIEEAKAFQKLIGEFGYNHEQVAQSVGKDRSTITNLLRLLNLKEYVQSAIISDQISMGHARALVGLDKEEDLKFFFDRTLAKDLSVRQLEEAIRSRKEQSFAAADKKSARKHHDMVMLEENLQRALGTKVQIFAKKKKGKIVIEYYSAEDLDRIVQIIKPD
ncbi:MAG: hypothetical protein COW13_04070 [Candidatus Omnitrophica bacterium CG12_big_fil_rev_8_21_14_0_65_50_5]|nr:MAG: hypothetical protein COW13_04070 [Candidatus Omnitrophica bacterium CG12_big_fil_rev_8_21_14_0_65_50_5]